MQRTNLPLQSTIQLKPVGLVWVGLGVISPSSISGNVGELPY